jgi:hypothetical protein
LDRLAAQGVLAARVIPSNEVFPQSILALLFHQVVRMMTTAAILVLFVHLIWIALVIFGALWTRGRPAWTTLHILSLLWGIAVEAGPWPCPLTLAEQYFETRAGLAAYQGSFLLHSLDAVVYPNFPVWLITAVGVSVCVFNLGIYAWRFREYRLRRRTPAGQR